MHLRAADDSPDLRCRCDSKRPPQRALRGGRAGISICRRPVWFRGPIARRRKFLRGAHPHRAFSNCRRSADAWSELLWLAVAHGPPYHPPLFAATGSTPMLQQMPRLSKSWISSIFLGLLALSFGVWGIADIFRGTTDTSVDTVGTD